MDARPWRKFTLAETLRVARDPAARYAAFVVAGAYGALSFPISPAPKLLAIAAGLAFTCWFVARVRMVGVLLGTFAFVGWAADRGVQQKLAPQLSGADQTAVFRLVSVPEHRGAQLRFVAEPLDAGRLPGRVRLSWYEAEVTPALGECWRLGVRLRRPRGFANPGAFDYAAWLYAQGIGATGYVRSVAGAVTCPVSPWAAARNATLTRLRTRLPDDQAAAVLQAITVGVRDRISDAQWQRFAATGTGHLMAISGMHVGLAAGSSFFLVWALSAALRARGNHRVAAAFGAVTVAAAYVMLSGAGIPARRALTMLLLIAMTLAVRRTVEPLQIFGLTVLAAVLTAPLDILSPGFKLSFAAVLLLIWQARKETRTFATAQRTRAFQWPGMLLRLQCALLLGMLPLSAGLFGRLAWSAPGANLLVVPIFNIVTAPTALLGLSLVGPAEAAGDGLLKLSWHSMRLNLFLIDSAARLPFAEQWVSLAAPAALLALALALVWTILPAGWPGRRAAWLALLALVVGMPQRVPPGCVDAHVLDVGQGLSVVVVTPNRTLVFDAGPAFRSGADTGRLVVVPFLRWLGRERADVVVLSHGDLDHAGGVASLVEAIPVSVVLAGERRPEFSPMVPCRAGQLWFWDDVEFRILHPGAVSLRRGNNASCVLSVRSGDSRILLTGDIEARAEAALLRGQLLDPVTAVVVPHHGSSTSSRPDFVDRLSARYAIVPAGYANRWGLPRQEVVTRWRESGATVLTTGHTGAVSLRLCAQTGLHEVRQERRARQRLWYDR